MQWFYTKLKYFNSSDRVLLINTLTEEKFHCLEDDEQKDLIFLFSKINKKTSAHSLQTVANWISEIFTYNYPFCMFKVHKGEDFSIVIELEDVVSGYNIVARESETGKLLSVENQLVNTGRFQQVNFIDLDLEENQFYKIQYQLEEINNPGDGVTLLGVSYFIVLKNLNN